MSDTLKTKIVWILWLQGWERAPWLQKQVAESWKINNPDWEIACISLNDVRNILKDIDYIYDKKKYISLQALSDIIRLSLLKNYGGVWADATMLCTKSLNDWVDEKIKNTGFWMYHGHGGDMPANIGPASWFIVSKKDNLIITKWKQKCDEYWGTHLKAHNYFWMDSLFKALYETDIHFKNAWDNVPYVYCESLGSAHTLMNIGMQNDTPELKEKLKNDPPYALKFNNSWNNMFSDVTTEKCQKSNGYFAIQLSKNINKKVINMDNDHSTQEGTQHP